MLINDVLSYISLNIQKYYNRDYKSRSIQVTKYLFFGRTFLLNINADVSYQS